MNKNFLIEISELCKNYIDENNYKINIINNLNFKLKINSKVSIIGPSGSGKTTFLNIIGLLDREFDGNFFFKQKNISLCSSNEINKIRGLSIGFIHQFFHLIPELTVIENVMLPLLIRNENHKKSFDKAKNILAKVNLSNRWNFFPSDLSGGEQQRVAIARSLIAETDLILADEPTGNVDFKTSKEIFDYFLKLKKMKKTILFATHNRELANKADYKLSISNGNIKRVNGKK